jgi:hypothetical protein
MAKRELLKVTEIIFMGLFLIAIIKNKGLSMKMGLNIKENF